MARNKRREITPVGVSFLDVVCCGFGAVLLLLVMTKVHQPTAVRESAEALAAQHLETQQQITETTARASALEARTRTLRAELERARAALAALTKRYAAHAAANKQSAVRESKQRTVEQRLQIAQQTLNRAQKKIAAQSGDRVGGIPVDSEYIIFVIDNSGSMLGQNWQRLLVMMDKILDAHPRVRGIQVLNDMGRYLIPGSSQQWLPDTAAQRRRIRRRLPGWRVWSNSSPVEGVVAAIRAFYAPDKRISLYVFGDDFSGRSVASAVRQIDSVNLEDESGARRVRIHGIGFPDWMGEQSGVNSQRRFAALMRELCQRNGGSFVGLTR